MATVVKRVKELPTDKKVKLAISIASLTAIAVSALLGASGQALGIPVGGGMPLGIPVGGGMPL